jgi:hypothetical protein
MDTQYHNSHDNGHGPLWHSPELATAGFPVFPVSKDGKDPTVEGGFYAATLDHSQLAEWITERGRKDHGVAFPTGAFSGVIVIDADNLEMVEWMRERYGEPTVWTKKGAHWYFRHPRRGKVTSNNVRKGLDRKGDGGYALLPPSKNYTWSGGIPDIASLPVLPEEFWTNRKESTSGERTMNRERKEAAVEAIASRVARILQGKRHEHLVHLSGVLLNHEVSFVDAEDILKAAWSKVGGELAERADAEIPNTLSTTQAAIKEGRATGVPSMEKITPGLYKELNAIFRWRISFTVGGKSSSDSSDSSDSFFQVLDEHTPFPVDAMPVKTRAFIREAAAAIDCFPELVGLPVLVTLSAALGHARELEVKRDYIQTAAIYAVGVASSGSGKTPAAGAAQKPLKKIQRKNGEHYKEKREDYEQELRAHKARVKQANKDGAPEPKPPAKPTWERTWVDNATIEALAKVLEKNPYGLAVFQDELTGWLGGFDQYKSGGKGNTRQQFIDIWGNNTIAIDRKGEEEPTVLERPFVSIYGNIQPKLVEEMGADRQDGFINRFLMAYPPHHEARENANEISARAELSYQDLVLELYTLRTPADDEKFIDTMSFAPGAHAVFMKHSNKLAQRASDPGNPQSLRETYPKLRAYLARIALLLATCRELEAGGNMEVTEDDIHAAARLVDYFEASARKVYHRLDSSDRGAKIAFELTSLLRKHGGSVEGTATEFQAWLPSAPTTPEATSKLLRKVVEREERLTLEETRPGHERALKISLIGKTVGTVGTVGGEEEQANNDPGKSGSKDPPHEEPVWRGTF